MGLSWQQGPLAAGAVGRFLVPDPLPERLLYAEPLRRRMRVRFGGSWIADSEDVVLLHEPGRYPVAYFPLGDIADGVLEATEHTTQHRDLGTTSWYAVRAGGQSKQRAAWQHTGLPAYAGELKGRAAFAWRAMDAFYEEDDRIVGHAADIYHRIDIRNTSRHLVVLHEDQVIADTTRPLALYESGFAPRWYVPREDVNESLLTAAELQTFCPYKGLCSYYNIGDARQAAWSYPDAWPDVRRIAGFISFEPDKVEVHLDGTRLRLEPGQSVVPHGADRDLTIDEAAPRRAPVITGQALTTGQAAATAPAGERDSREPVLVSVNVGMPKDVSWQGKTVYTGVWKQPVDGPAMVRRLNIDGDGQGDTNGHGGEQRAVLVYQVQSYDHWRQHFGRDDFTYGQFGENLTVSGLADDEVCIGDRYRIGEAEFEVTQPRVTCYRVGMRLGEPELPALLVSHHRPGFYMRVITEGRIQAGDAIVKTRTGPGALSVADTDALLYLPNRDPAKLRLALQIPALSPGWQGSFRELSGAPGDPDIAAVGGRGAEPAWAGFRELVVTEVIPESTTVSSIRLAAVDGARLPAARAGQYLTLRIPGAGQPAPVRSYSLSSAPSAGDYRISVKHEPHGAASGYLTTKLRAGAVLDVAAPRGDFVLEPGTGPVLLISAGIGLTPVISMLHELADSGSEREIWWIHGARGPEEHPLAAEADALLSSLPHARTNVFYSAATPDTPEESRGANVTPGRLTKDRLAALALPADATPYICGPASFMTDMQDALAELGIDPARIRTELFGALPPINPGLTGQASRPPHQPPGPPGTGPLVTFARSGISVPFREDNRSVLELADACDVPARWACRTGVCHTCVTSLLSGKVAYFPEPLELPASGQVLICCSRPGTDIVLDM